MRFVVTKWPLHKRFFFLSGFNKNLSKDVCDDKVLTKNGN